MAIQYSQPGKPNQNAYVERFNRTYREELPDQYGSHHSMMFEKPPGGGCMSTTKNEPMAHWAVARAARFINPPETLLLNCNLDGEAYVRMGLKLP